MHEELHAQVVAVIGLDSSSPAPLPWILQEEGGVGEDTRKGHIRKREQFPRIINSTSGP